MAYPLMMVLCVANVLASPFRPPKVVTHTAPALLPGWAPVMRRGHAAQTTSFLISLRPTGRDTIRQLASNVSDPQSPLYGKYLQRSQLNAIARPEPAHLAIVERWLRAFEVNFTTPWGSSNVLSVETTVVKAEQLLSTQYEQLICASTGQIRLRAGSIHLPAEVDMVATIFGLHGLPLPPRQAQSGGNPGGTKGQPITPQLLRGLYGVSSSVARTNSSKATVNLQGSMLGGIKLSDLKLFFKQFVPVADSVDAQWTNQHGDVNLQGDAVSVEGSMDIQYIKGVAPEVATQIWNYNSADFCSDLKRWLSDMLSMDQPPELFSLSYGWQGDLNRVGCTEAHVLDIETNLQQAALRGITIIVSSGDFGAAVGGERRSGKPNTLYPAWPSSSPFVTSVGATEFSDTGSERAVSSFGSGGGFSLYPGSSDRTHATWQEVAVQSYLNSSVRMPKAAGGWSATGRATPDVSALGAPQFQIIVGGESEQNGGTSASAPVFAALVSLLNAARLEAGMPLMGLITPFLYQNPQAFTDVVDGDNSVCGWWTSSTDGFTATSGWDPVTGLGTPIFPKLLAAALGKPVPPSAPPSAAPTHEPTHSSSSPPAAPCSWQTANVNCSNDHDCSDWVVSYCDGRLSEWYCRENGFCHFQGQ